MKQRKPSPEIRALAARLSRPMASAPIADLQQLWYHEDIIIVCQRPMGLEDQPDLALRIRGALGNALEELCAYPPVRAIPFVRETAHELLYFWPVPQTQTCFGSTEVAVPWTIRAAMSAREVRVVIRLLGEARLHAPIAAAAAVMALETGVSLRNHAIRVPFPVKFVTEYCFDGGTRDWNVSASSALLRFLTPVVIRSGNHIRLEPEALLRSASRRVAALAPWMGFALDADELALNHAIDQLSYQIDIHPEQWLRTSRRDPGKAVKVFAYGGAIRMAGNMESLIPYLQLAEISGVGGECASGFGAFELVECP